MKSSPQHLAYNRARYWAKRDLLLAQKKEYAQRPEVKEYLREYRQAWRARHLEDQAAYKKAWYAERREEMVRRSREHYQNNREQHNANSKQWAARNPEKRRQIGTAWAERNRSEINSRINKWRHDNPDQLRELARQWGARRRARKRGAAVIDFTPEQWAMLRQVYGGRCAYCAKPTAKPHQDHVIPLSKGGPHTASNIRPACAKCNLRKHTKTWVPLPWAAKEFEAA